MLLQIADLETGGLNPKKHSIFSVGALVGDLDTGIILDQFEAYHKLPSINDYVFEQEAIDVHGITPLEAFNKGISTVELQAKLIDMWTENGVTLLGGHNFDFDVRFLASQLYGISTEEFKANFTHRIVDSFAVIALFSGSENIQQGKTLKQTVKSLGIDMNNYGKNKYHTALFDAICCFKILCKFRSVLTDATVIDKLTK